MSRIDSDTPPNGSASAALMDPRRRRAASVTLRQGEARAHSVGDLMDPANKSLADALRIAYVLLQVLIGVMIVIFLFSGMQTVGASEVGVRTFVGKIDTADLQPGLHFSWPEPIGNILKVQTNEQKIELKKEFFPALTTAEETLMIDKGVLALQGGRNEIDPDTDGALLTADGSLVHTRWLVTYRRTNTWRSLERIAQDSDSEDPSLIERQIVTAAVRRGIVHAAATMTIDEVLYNQPDPARKGVFIPMSDAARKEAQDVLKAMDIGIEIQQFNIQTPMPPRFVMQEFSAVQIAQSEASKKRDVALTESRRKLTQTAGIGAPILLSQINLYGVQLADGKGDDAAKTLGTIQDLMENKPVTIDGKPVPAVVSGNVSATIAAALQYRTSIVSRAQADAEAYSAKLQAFHASPEVFLMDEWKDAYVKFAQRPGLQTLLLPTGLERLVVQINKDPTLAKMMADAIAQKEAQEQMEKIKKRREQELFNKQFEGTGLEGV